MFTLSPMIPSDSLEIVASRLGFHRFSTPSMWYCSPTAGSLVTGRPYCARAGAAVARISRIAPASHRAEGTQTLRMFVFSAPDALNITAGLHAGSLGENRGGERSVPHTGPMARALGKAFEE